MRPWRIRVAALNLRIHEKRLRSYDTLMQDMVRAKSRAKFYGGHTAVLRTAAPDGPYTSGEIVRYLDLELRSKWINLNALDEANPDEVTAEVRIPKHLRPEYRSIEYVFDAENHRLYFASEDIAPSHMRKILKSFVSAQTIVEKYGVIDVTIEQSREELVRLFAMPHIDWIKIKIVRPNSDHFSDVSERVEERLTQESARVFTQEFRAFKAKSLTPSAETKELAEVAVSTGSVEAHGHGFDGVPETVTTRKHPILEAVDFLVDSKKTAIKKAASTLWLKIKSGANL